MSVILDARQLPEKICLEAEVVIIGGGPAGITLAHQLAGGPRSVLLIEAGLDGAKGPSERFEGEIAQASRHPTLGLYRVERLGGTSGLWGGRCVPFDPQDFEPRAYVPHSGWPLTFSEMQGWYRAASRYTESGSGSFLVSEIMGPDAAAMIEGWNDPGIDLDAVERFSCPTDFGTRYRADLDRASNVRTVLGAICTKLVPDPGRQTIDHIECASDPGRRFTVRAQSYVLAAGGLESTRLMLAANIGNDRDLLGRFYMCHVEGKAAEVHFKRGTRVTFQYERDAERVYFRRRFSIPSEVQRANKMTNVILRFEPPVIADPAHGSPILSAMWLSRTFLKREYARKLASFGYRGLGPTEGWRLAAGHAGNVLAGMPSLFSFAADWARRRWLAQRKLPYVALAGRNSTFSLDYNAEQVPNPESRVTLAGSTDAFGVPRLLVDWRISEQDTEGVLTAHHLLARALDRTGLGGMTIDEEAIRHGANAIGGHHVGTARMADDPTSGVVDGDGKVFGLENLYVSGSATFPTSSHANPTLTIVALACRMAKHLAGRRGHPAEIHPVTADARKRIA
jgi:choline dehydrogenase-like flavoprotein